MAAVIGSIVSAHRSSMEGAAAGTGEVASLETGIELARRVTPTGGSVFLATGLDDAGPEFEPLASALRRRCLLTVLLIVDAFERDPRPGTYPFVSRSGRIGRATLDRSHFRRVSDGRRERLEKLGVTFIEIETDLDSEGMAERLEIFDGRVR